MAKMSRGAGFSAAMPTLAHRKKKKRISTAAENNAEDHSYNL